MSSFVILGQPLPLERRGVPAMAAGVSVALHGALFFIALAGWEGRLSERPVLAAAKNELALSIARPSPPRAKPAREPEDSPVEAPRPVPRTESLERVDSPRPEVEAVPPPPARIERTTAPVADVARPEVEILSRAAFESPGGIRAPMRLGDARPRYPPACQGERHRRGGCEGTGRYVIEVDATGRVLSAMTAESAGCARLDAEAVRFFLREARFEPATMDGVPIPWEGRIVIRFDLKERGAGRE